MSDLSLSDTNFSQALLDTVGALITVLDLDGRFVGFNRASEQLTGYTFKEVRGRSYGMFLLPEEHADVSYVIEQLAAGVAVQHQNFWVTRSGEKRWIHWSNTAMLDEDGRVRYLLATGIDMTEQMENGRAFLAEKELNELRSNFVSMVTHQMGTPLSTILSSAELLQNYADHWPVERREKHLQRIIESTQRMDRMIRDILELGQVNAMVESSQPVPVDLTHFCQRIVEIFQVSDHSRHEIVFTGPDLAPGSLQGAAPVCGWLDENLVAPILENLLSNALKYSPEHSRIELGLAIEENWLIFWVQDEGLGIPAEELQRVGKPFYRGKNVINFPGTGLGLAMVKLSLNALGGSLKIDSVENMGTKIWVRLPFRRAALRRLRRGAEAPGLDGDEAHE